MWKIFHITNGLLFWIPGVLNSFTFVKSSDHFDWRVNSYGDSRDVEGQTGTNPWRHMVDDFNSINSYIAYYLSCDGVVSILEKIFALSCRFVSFNPTNQQKLRTLQFLHALSWNHKNNTMRRPEHQTIIIPSWYLIYFPIPSCHRSVFASLETELYED